MTDRWVINASPLILLGKVGQLDWVPQLGEIVVPSAVADENWPERKMTPRASGLPMVKGNHW